jgi:hypothetical protein
MLRAIVPVMLVLLTACAASRPTPHEWREIRLTPDDPAKPRAVRFDVPTALLMGLPGDHLPLTLEARVNTRGLAARELATAGYCPNGFNGPEAIFFPGGDRSRSAFIVHCVG